MREGVNKSVTLFLRLIIREAIHNCGVRVLSPILDSSDYWLVYLVLALVFDTASTHTNYGINFDASSDAVLKQQPYPKHGRITDKTLQSIQTHTSSQL